MPIGSNPSSGTLPANPAPGSEAAEIAAMPSLAICNHCGQAQLVCRGQHADAQARPERPSFTIAGTGDGGRLGILGVE